MPALDLERIRANFHAAFDDGEALYQRWLKYPDAARVPALRQMLSLVSKKADLKLPQSFLYKEQPVDPETFLRDKYFLGLEDELYPEVVPHFIELNSGKYVEAVLTGGVGSAKTSVALWTCGYQAYLLSMMTSPHAAYGIARTDEIEMIFQSLTAELAKGVDFMRFRGLIERSPYFQKHFPHNPELKSELHFPGRIIIKPVSGSNLATIGQNVIGGLIDELNYGSVVEKSKKMSGGDTGVFNQAIEQYNSISRRRLSRFYSQGFMPGILCLVSSKKYPGQFTDMKEAERLADIAKKGTSPIYLYDKRMWDIKPWAFSSERFEIFTGDEFRKPRILAEGEKVAKGDEKSVIQVPVDLLKPFQDDIVNALREIAGVSHMSKSPFFTNPEKLRAAFTKRKSIFTADVTDFNSLKVGIIKRIEHPEIPRWAHVDLGLTGDSAGVALGYCPGFVTVKKPGMTYQMPRIVYDGVLEVRPPKGDEIQFARIRGLFFILRDELGVNVKWITYDSWQSVDSVQLLRQKGFTTGTRSIDTTMLPADFFKEAVYDGRADMPWHPKLWEECKDVQIDFKKQKVDHLPQGSKDLFDAACGVAHGLTTRREVWTMYGVPVVEFVEQAVREAAAKVKGKGSAAT